jgi:poly(U)-binding-splicing factor PUF60
MDPIEAHRQNALMAAQAMAAVRSGHLHLYPQLPSTPIPTPGPKLPLTNSSLSTASKSVKDLRPLSTEEEERLKRAKEYAKEVTARLFPLGTTLPAEISPAMNGLSPNSNNSRITPYDISNLSRLYVGGLQYSINEPEIREIFQELGPIKNVFFNIDPATTFHKGFCFLEYEYPESAHMAQDVFNGTSVAGKALKVGRPSSYNPYTYNLAPPDPNRIFIANVNVNVTEEMLKDVFLSFGPVQECILSVSIYV